MMLMVPGVYSGYVVGLAWISNSIPRPPAKRAAALAFVNAISNTSSIYASYMYSEKDSKSNKVLLTCSHIDSISRTKICDCHVCKLRYGSYGYYISHDIKVHSSQIEQEIGTGQ